MVLPSSECLILAEDRTVHPRLRAVAIELGMYGVNFVVDRAHESDGSWLASFLAREAVAAHEPEERRAPIPHVPTTVWASRTGRATTLPVPEADAFHLYFDGRSAGGVGSGGFVGYWPGGECAGGGGGPYPGRCTVNEAEAEAMLAALRWLTEVPL